MTTTEIIDKDMAKIVTFTMTHMHSILIEGEFVYKLNLTGKCHMISKNESLES